MMQQPERASLRLKRLAVLATLLVVVRVLGWELHQLAAPHVPGQTCEVCLVAERCGDAIPTSAAAPEPLRAVAPVRGYASLPWTTLAPCPPARGPPSQHA